MTRAPGRDTNLATALQERVSAVLDEARTTYELWRRVADLRAPAPGDPPLAHALRNALKTELARREASDEERLYELVEEALITGDLRPYWSARELFAATSPEVTGRLFLLEPDVDDQRPPPDPEVTEEAYRSARAIIRARIAEIEEASPTGSMLVALAIIEEAITREQSPMQKPLIYALQVERQRQARTERNLLRTRLALALSEGRSYSKFLECRSAAAELSAEDWTRIFDRASNAKPPSRAAGDGGPVRRVPRDAATNGAANGLANGAANGANGHPEALERPRIEPAAQFQPEVEAAPPPPPEPPAAPVHAVRRVDKDVPVTVPGPDAGGEPPRETADSIEAGMLRALLVEIGSRMGMQIWVAPSARQAVVAEWKGDPSTLLERLPLNYDETTLRTVEQLDVLWLKGRAIRRAFVVEPAATVHAGVSRIADLLALQPNLDVRFHVVAPGEAREKVFAEIRRPVYSVLDRGPLSESCTFVSYARARDLAGQPHLAHLSDSVLGEYEERLGE